MREKRKNEKTKKTERRALMASGVALSLALEAFFVESGCPAAVAVAAAVVLLLLLLLVVDPAAAVALAAAGS